MVKGKNKKIEFYVYSCHNITLQYDVDGCSLIILTIRLETTN